MTDIDSRGGRRADKKRLREGGKKSIVEEIAKRGRKVRGLQRDGRPQLSIKNFVSKLVRGDNGSAGPSGK